MAAVEETELWKRSLGTECESEDAEKFRKRLSAALELMHERSAALAGEIARDLPDFTVHDVSHSDALWGLADRIADSQIKLSPTEAFVFGAAVLVHDLGMASAAYVDGPDSLKTEPRWSDTVASMLRQGNGRVPTPEEIVNPAPAVVDRAKSQILRELHAQHAEKLVAITWEDSGGNQYALLDDSDLRVSMGAIIGKIAHSHWWGVGSLEEKLPGEMGALPRTPSDWTIRPLILACLLRLADASHLDGSRAPRFLRLLRAPSAEAAQHWDFQGHLSQPVRRDDRFIFTGTPFGPQEADAWWLCADTLEAVDREFRAVDSLLADRQQPRFAVHGVSGADDLSILSAHIPTSGWTPIDAKVRVSNVVRLVERLGGRELYGSKPEIPLRELIQNGSDAVRARRVVQEEADDWGSIVVSVSDSEDEGRGWLEVEDCGVGMSRSVLTDHLLDFGTSFWDSDRVIDEFPRLPSSSFESIGRYGIGFFSVFMWGGDVDVISRRYDAGLSETHVLEFRGGVAKRPLLREARPDEQLKKGGTRVRILLDAETIWRLGIEPGEPKAPVLRQLCGWLAPALDVDLFVEDRGERLQAVKANDWMDMPMDELGVRISESPVRHTQPYPPEKEPEPQDPPPESEVEKAAREEREREAEAKAERLLGHVRANARPLQDERGAVVGRLALGSFTYRGGVTVIGGLRATPLTRVTGILRARPTTASRNGGLPLAGLEGLARWASEQALLSHETESPFEVAEVIWACGGDTNDLPVVETREGLLSFGEVKEWADGKDAVTAVFNLAVEQAERADGRIELRDHVVKVSASPAYLISSDTGLTTESPLDFWPLSLKGGWLDTRTQASLVGAFAAAVGAAWGMPGEELAGTGYQEAVVGDQNGVPLELSAEVWRRPS